MPLGPFVRKMAGPFEKPISLAYRSFFVDLNSLARQISSWVPDSKVWAILEVGCGEGILAEVLATAYPKAQITGIDPAPRIGRLFEGDSKRVVFKQQTINEYAGENPSSVDLVVISDVMHHAPREEHRELLALAGKSLKPEGYLILKDWERNRTPIHLICYLLDRYITGARVFYKTAGEFRDLIEDVFGSGSIKDSARIGPWRNNVVFLAHSGRL